MKAVGSSSGRGNCAEKEDGPVEACGSEAARSSAEGGADAGGVSAADLLFFFLTVRAGSPVPFVHAGPAPELAVLLRVKLGFACVVGAACVVVAAAPPSVEVGIPSDSADRTTVSGCCCCCACRGRTGTVPTEATMLAS